MKFNKYEQLTLDAVTVILSVTFTLIRLTLKALNKSKRWLVRLAIVILIFNSALTAVQRVAYAPRANASEFRVVDKPQTEHEQIVNYIYEVFGKDADKAFLLLSCENKSLNPEAVHDNEKWGQGLGKDFSIFQVNDHWQGVQGKFLLNWRVNVLIAHQIYVENGHSFKLWTCGRNLGI